jgi:hypothetical protein
MVSNLPSRLPKNASSQQKKTFGIGLKPRDLPSVVGAVSEMLKAARQLK